MQSQMDKRSWPWKKKSSEKTKTDKSVPASDPDGASAGSLGGQVTHNDLVAYSAFKSIVCKIL